MLKIRFPNFLKPDPHKEESEGLRIEHTEMYALAIYILVYVFFVIVSLAFLTTGILNWYSLFVSVVSFIATILAFYFFIKHPPSLEYTRSLVNIFYVIMIAFSLYYLLMFRLALPGLGFFLNIPPSITIVFLLIVLISFLFNQEENKKEVLLWTWAIGGAIIIIWFLPFVFG